MKQIKAKNVRMILTKLQMHEIRKRLGYSVAFILFYPGRLATPLTSFPGSRFFQGNTEKS